jgi:hypothetical protein
LRSSAGEKSGSSSFPSVFGVTKCTMGFFYQ